MSSSMPSLYVHLVFLAVTAENAVSHKSVLEKDTRTLLALSDSSEYSWKHASRITAVAFGGTSRAVSYQTTIRPIIVRGQLNRSTGIPKDFNPIKCADIVATEILMKVMLQLL
ncbi:hypothetical protein RF11_02887 [Thelohanellus kitauei]|uniref:Uncharacterized protein n=1 Tax=Thelohanellus kitauei TaxID=669202 RepID=A0A0C2MU00_THEKT|nr:hypothetical protein RF11_02887 [Thelohanellus kitauei]